MAKPYTDAPKNIATINANIVNIVTTQLSLVPNINFRIIITSQNNIVLLYFL